MASYMRQLQKRMEIENLKIYSGAKKIHFREKILFQKSGLLAMTVGTPYLKSNIRKTRKHAKKFWRKSLKQIV